MGDGTDTITDFEMGIGSMGLLGRLSFGAITQTVDGTNPLLDTSGENLAVIQDVTAPLAEASSTEF